MLKNVLYFKREKDNPIEKPTVPLPSRFGSGTGFSTKTDQKNRDARNYDIRDNRGPDRNRDPQNRGGN